MVVDMMEVVVVVVGVKVLSATEKQSKSGGGDRAEDATERREKE